MTNSSPIIDNTERSKSKKKKEALEVHLSKLMDINIDDKTLSGPDISAYADALAGAKIALKSIEDAVSEAEKILKSAMLRQYCDHFTSTGHPPDIRRSIGSVGSFTVVQQNSAKVTAAKAEELKLNGIDIASFKEKSSYAFKLAGLDDGSLKSILGTMRMILADQYDDVVSEYTHVGKEFFDNLDTVVRESLSKDERLDEKMLYVLRILNPTIQFKDFKSDLDEPQGFDLAFEFAHISSRRKPK